MLEKLKQAGNAAKDAVTKTAIHLGDLNRDGKVDEEDARIASEWAKKQAENHSHTCLTSQWVT